MTIKYSTASYMFSAIILVLLIASNAMALNTVATPLNNYSAPLYGFTISTYSGLLVAVPYDDMWLRIKFPSICVGIGGEPYYFGNEEMPQIYFGSRGDWFIVGGMFHAYLKDLPQYKLLKYNFVARNGDLVVIYMKIVNIGDDITIDHPSSHIHDGVDGISIIVVPPGWRVSTEWEQQHYSEEDSLLSNTLFYDDYVYRGTLKSLGLWQVFPAGIIRLQHGESFIDISPVNSASSSNYIQIVTNSYYFGGQRISTSVLELQHAAVTLGTGESAEYLYVAALGRNITDDDIAAAEAIKDELIPSSTALVKIYSDIGGSIYLNGTFVGNITDAAYNFTVSPGMHNVTVINPENPASYFWITSTLEPSEELVLYQPLKTRIPQPVLNGTISISSTTAAVDVYVNGTYMGTVQPGSTLTLSLEPGAYNVTFIAEGYTSSYVILKLGSAETINITDPFSQNILQRHRSQPAQSGSGTQIDYIKLLIIALIMTSIIAAIIYRRIKIKY